MPRLLLTLVLLGFIAFTVADHNDKYKEYLKDCMKEFPKVTETVLQSMHKKDFKTTEKDIFCFVKCMGVKNGILNEKGSIDIEKVFSQNGEIKDKDKLKAAHEKCVGETGADPCETAYKQWRCMGDQVGWE